MKITTDMIGKKVIRTAQNKKGDTSYTSYPVVLTNITEGHLYIASEHSSTPHGLLRCSWDDKNWDLFEPHAQKCSCDRCPKCGKTI